MYAAKIACTLQSVFFFFFCIQPQCAYYTTPLSLIAANAFLFNLLPSSLCNLLFTFRAHLLSFVLFDDYGCLMNHNDSRQESQSHHSALKKKKKKKKKRERETEVNYNFRRRSIILDTLSLTLIGLLFTLYNPCGEMYLTHLSVAKVFNAVHPSVGNLQSLRCC